MTAIEGMDQYHTREGMDRIHPRAGMYGVPTPLCSSSRVAVSRCRNHIVFRCNYEYCCIAFASLPACELDQSTSTPSRRYCCRLRTSTPHAYCCTSHLAVRVRGCDAYPARLRRSHLQPYYFSLCAMGAAAAAGVILLYFVLSLCKGLHQHIKALHTGVAYRG